LPNPLGNRLGNRGHPLGNRLPNRLHHPRRPLGNVVPVFRLVSKGFLYSYAIHCPIQLADCPICCPIDCPIRCCHWAIHCPMIAQRKVPIAQSIAQLDCPIWDLDCPIDCPIDWAMPMVHCPIDCPINCPFNGAHCPIGLPNVIAQ